MHMTNQKPLQKNASITGSRDSDFISEFTGIFALGEQRNISI